MTPGRLLVVFLASMLILSSAVILLDKDVLSQEPDYAPQSFLSIREVDVRPVEVTSALAEVNVTAYVNHAGGKTKSASMLLRAISSDTGLLAAQAAAPIPETASEKTLAISQHLTVERNGGYEIEILLFDNDSIRDSGSITVRGLSAITPQSKQSGIVLGNIDFIPSSVSAGRVSIKSDIYLENRGQGASESLNLIAKARQADSNLLADKKSSETGTIASEATAVKSMQLDVPDGYNYMVVVELWRGDVLVNSWEKPVLLAPTKIVPKESAEKTMKIEVSKFVREGATGTTPVVYGTINEQRGMPKTPGFEELEAITALIAVIALRRRVKW